MPANKEALMFPKISHILYATDLSESARLALRHAASLANHYQASLTIIHILPDWVEMMSEEAGFDIETHFDQQTWQNINATATAKALKKAEDRVSEMASECRVDAPGCPVAKADIKIVQGDAAACILKELDSGVYDMVVMGAHGQGPFVDMLLGSVANKIVRMSPVPVLTVRLPKEDN
jgi:nucleotide-binding universal stress UspA family protein